MTPGRYVVIGASGILAPLGGLLHAGGVITVGVSRGRQPVRGTWDELVLLDVREPRAVAAWLADEHVARAVVAYEPAVASDCWPLLSAAAQRLVVVATRRWAAPGAPLPPWEPLASCVVLLGWVAGPGVSRWHTPEEVSAAVARALASGSTGTVLVGTCGPWVDRPA